MRWTMVSGQMLEPPPWTRRLSPGKPMQTYAAVWVNPDEKHYTRIDKHGGPDPNWNHTFMFSLHLGPEYLLKENVNIHIEIYSAAVGLMLKDELIGRHLVEVKGANPIPLEEIMFFQNRGIFRDGAVRGSIDFSITCLDQVPESPRTTLTHTALTELQWLPEAPRRTTSSPYACYAHEAIVFFAIYLLTSMFILDLHEYFFQLPYVLFIMRMLWDVAKP